MSVQKRLMAINRLERELLISLEKAKNEILDYETREVGELRSSLAEDALRQLFFLKCRIRNQNSA